MPFRQLPRSDEGLTTALRRAYTHLQHLSADQQPVAPATVAALEDFLTRPLTNWFALETAAGTALAAQYRATRAYRKAFNRCVMYCSHFIQVLNLAIVREELTPPVRAYYGLDMNSEQVPLLDSDADVLHWGLQLINGETNRVAAGGKPRAEPTIEQVAAAYEAFRTTGQQARDACEAYQKRLQDIAKQRPEARRLITEIWDDVENHYRRQPPPTRRRLCRVFGVVYVAHTTDKVFDGTLLAGTTALVLRRLLPPNTQLRVTNESADASLRLCVATTPHLPPDFVGGVTVPPASTHVLPRTALGPAAGRYLLLTNQSPIAEADWRVELVQA